MAETDWLAYVLIAFFQESTVQFSKDCRVFYDEVERSYGLHGIFDPWWKHIELDIEFCHSRNLEVIFDSNRRLPAAQVVNSLTTAWIAFRFLLSSLDEIVRESRQDPDIKLRSPISLGVIDLSVNSFGGVYRAVPEGAIQLPTNGTMLDLHLSMHQHELTSISIASGKFQAEDLKFLRLDTAQSIYRALSYAESGRETLLLGRLAEIAFRNLSSAEQHSLSDNHLPATAEAMALANFLRELAIRPIDFCFVLHPFVSACHGELSLDSAGLTKLTEFFETVSLHVVGDMLITKRLQMIEFILGWQQSCEAVSRSSFFEGEPVGELSSS
jgi:hypothetical protein